ncbi:hypothetical protein ACWCRF_14150 [Streptomyces sp. NPDC002405]
MNMAQPTVSEVDLGSISLPFGRAKTSPVAAGGVAAVVEEILADPAPHIGRIDELTGPRSEDIAALTAEVSVRPPHGHRIGSARRIRPERTRSNRHGRWQKTVCTTQAASTAKPSFRGARSEDQSMLRGVC